MQLLLLFLFWKHGRAHRYRLIAAGNTVCADKFSLDHDAYTCCGIIAVTGYLLRQDCRWIRVFDRTVISGKASVTYANPLNTGKKNIISLNCDG